MNISIMFICCVPLTYFQMFGRNLFTVNCNEDVTVGVMMQYMMGMVQSGSWTLFDNTDRLTKGTQHRYFYLLFTEKYFALAVLFWPTIVIVIGWILNFTNHFTFMFFFFLLEEEIWIEIEHSFFQHLHARGNSRT